MKKFIYKTLFFLALPVMLYAGTFLILKSTFKSEIRKFQTIILGDSQTENIKHAKIFNRSIEGSPYFVHYEFAKEFIDELKGKRVYISCNYHNFSRLYQNRLNNDSLFPGWRDITFQSLDSYNMLNHKYAEFRPKDLAYSFFDIKKLPRFYRSIYFPIKKQNSIKSIELDTMSIDTAVYRHWKHPKYVLDDKIQHIYFEKLIHLLKENNCEVVLLKMPNTRYYIQHVPKGIHKYMYQISQSYKIRLLDLNKSMDVSHNYSIFKDYGHLNKKGDKLIIDYLLKNEFDQLR